MREEAEEEGWSEEGWLNYTSRIQEEEDRTRRTKLKNVLSTCNQCCKPEDHLTNSSSKDTVSWTVLIYSAVSRAMIAPLVSLLADMTERHAHVFY